MLSNCAHAQVEYPIREEEHYTCNGVANCDGNHVVHNILPYRDWCTHLHAKRNLQSGDIKGVD